MSKTTSQPSVSIIIVTYNSHDYLKNCLQSLKKISYRPLELIIFDNDSQDKTVELVQKKAQDWPYPLKVIDYGHNAGYAQGNNLAVEEASGDYIFFLNPDTEVKPDFLQPLVKRAESEPQIAVCQPTVYLMQEKEKVNLTGKVSHYLGFDWIKDYQKTKIPQTGKITSFSGSGVLIKKEIFLDLAGFDDYYFMYYEDSDLSWRLRLAGYELWYVAESVLYHDYKYTPNENYQPLRQKIFHIERNRLITLYKNYSIKTLCLILPMMVMMELALLIYATLEGWGRQKLESYQQIWQVRHHLRHKREWVQAQRKVGDKKLTTDFVSQISFMEFNHPIIKYALNPLMWLYWRLIRIWI